MTVMVLGSYHFYTNQNLFRVHECRFSRYLAGNARVFLNFLDRIQTLWGRSLLRIPPGAVGGRESA